MALRGRYGTEGTGADGKPEFNNANLGPNEDGVLPDGVVSHHDFLLRTSENTGISREDLALILPMHI